jgi:hypothetical protein
MNAKHSAMIFDGRASNPGSERSVTMPIAITVEGKMLGQRKPLFSDWWIDLPPEGEDASERLTLRALITRLVREEVRAFGGRQEQRRLTRVLTKTEIDERVARGKVDMGGHDDAGIIDPEAAVAAALQAFEDGLYHVFIDDEQQQKLEGEVYLKPQSRVTFLRLVALVGG